jgi:hypothetical protein
MDGVRTKKKKSQKKNKNKNKMNKTKIAGPVDVVAASCRGCHIVHSDCSVSWPIFGFERFEREEYGLGPDDVVPDMTIDEDGVLTVLNASATQKKSYYISTACPCFDAAGMPLQQSDYVDAVGVKGRCTTLILTVAPLSSLAVCRVEGSNLFSHVSDLPSLSDEIANATPHRVGFPLGGGGPFLCSQGRGGQLSHFGVQRFAVDLECPCGSLVIACNDGEVLEVRDKETCTGPYAENLFHWNSVMLQLAGGPVVELRDSFFLVLFLLPRFRRYVHIRAGSARVRVGERVFRGQPLCETGDVGFCPVPHLHFQCHDSASCDAPTVPFVFETDDGQSVFQPLSGGLYSSKGLVKIK